MSATITPLLALRDNYIWILVNEARKTVAAVDPGEAAPVEAFLQAQGLTLTDILITHHHYDHTGGVAQLVRTYQPTVYASSQGRHPDINFPLNEGDHIVLTELETEFDVISIPGHTLDHTAFYGPLGLFSGDTLFAAGCGRVFEGSYPQMHDSLMRLKRLPPDTLIYCGHEYTQANLQFAQMVEPNNPDIQVRIEQVNALRAQNKPSLPSRMALECKTNPFLRCDEPDVKAAAERFCGHRLYSREAVFEVIRNWKDRI